MIPTVLGREEKFRARATLKPMCFNLEAAHSSHGLSASMLDTTDDVFMYVSNKSVRQGLSISRSQIVNGEIMWNANFA
jgi:hypothetical protein